MDTQRSTRARRQVALVYPLAVPWMAVYVRGVMDYAQRHGGWSLATSPPALMWAGEEMLSLEGLRGWPGDGVIAGIISESDIRAARRLKLPVVNMAATLRETGFPLVMPDHRGMGRLAAEHFLERGLRRLAFYGVEGLWFSEQRCLGFCERAREAGVTCDVLEVPRLMGPKASWTKRTAQLIRWLKQLRPPVGLLALQDYRARVAMEECDRLGLRVPHDVAVCGMEDDQTICEISRPTLSSVSRNSWRLGFESAAMLDRMMDGRPPGENIVIPSDGVIARQSTDTIAVEDPHLAAAVHYIHDHLAESFSIERIVQATSISRRQLEVRFRRVLGCSPLDYVCRKRTERAKQLLGSPGRVKLRNVATACGFSSLERMRMVFKRQTGQTPLEYRQAEQMKITPP